MRPRCILVLLAYFGIGCLTTNVQRQVHQPANAADFRYYIRELRSKARQRMPRARVLENMVSGYQRLGGGLFSECKNAPSDSQYADILLADPSCGGLEAISLTVGRLLWEDDRSRISPLNPVLIAGKLRWVDVPQVCNYNY